jgi:thimet oligopeptidase
MRQCHCMLLFMVGLSSICFAGSQHFNSTPFYSRQQDLASFKRLQTARLNEIQNLINHIITVKGKRTIQNTLELYEEAFILVDSVAYESSVLRNVHPDTAMREAATEILKESTKAITELNVNVSIYEALNSLDLSNADGETAYYVKTLLDQMRGRGALASAEGQGRIRKLEEELLLLDQEFQENMTNDSRTVVVNHVSELAGLPQSFLDQHPPDSTGQIILKADGSDSSWVAQYASNDELRRKMYIETLNQAYPTNVDVLRQMLAKRHELANLYGFPTWAAYKSSFSMMKTPQEISHFLDQLAETARGVAVQRNQALLRQKRQEYPTATVVNPWEVSYWNAKLEAAEKTKVDWIKISEYFPYESTKLGIFRVFERMFGIRFQQLKNAPVWHPTVECWEVFEGHKLIGRVYLDLCRRPEKFWEDVQYAVRTGIARRQLAESVIVCGFFEYPKRKTEFFSYRDAETFFHELGHSLHNIFAGNHRWIGVGGARTETDFKEVPSQLLEEWMHDTVTLRTFAKHYKSGEPIPEQLVQQIQKSRDFDQVEQVLDFLFYSQLSLKLYETDPAQIDLTGLVKRLTNKYSPYPYVEGTHSECSFQYLISHTSEFYAFLLSQVIAKDFFTQFNQLDLLAPAPASRYRDLILAPGGSESANLLVERFLGRPFSFKPWQNWLKNTSVNPE